MTSVHRLPLRLAAGHLFVDIAGAAWLVDTGAPTSFGAAGAVSLAGRTFPIASSYFGLDAAELSAHVHTECAGLLGTDVLGVFDHRFDVPAGWLTIAEAPLALEGVTVPLDEVFGIPIVTVDVAGRRVRCFLDTGAQLSYLQSLDLTSFPEAGRTTDFYPGVGTFETDTWQVPFVLGGVPVPGRCGRLPELLGLTLLVAGVEGILGNAFLADRVVGYFPRRRELVVPSPTGG